MRHLQAILMLPPNWESCPLDNGNVTKICGHSNTDEHFSPKKSKGMRADKMLIQRNSSRRLNDDHQENLWCSMNCSMGENSLCPQQLGSYVSQVHLELRDSTSSACIWTS